MKKIRLSLCGTLNMLVAASLIAVSVPSHARDADRRVTTGKLLPPGIPVPGANVPAPVPGGPLPVPVPVPVPTPPVVVERYRNPPVVVERHRDYRDHRGWDRHWHHDKWSHKHDRYHGRIYRTLPPDVFTLYLGGGTFFYYSGTFYRHNGDGYVVVEAPVGARVRILPDNCAPFFVDGIRYYECDNVYYESVDGEYVVIEAPPGRGDEAEIGEEVWITANNLNIRSGPSRRNRVIGQLYRGDVVEVSGKEGDWYYIRMRGGNYGWIMKEHARLYQHRID